ncbi:uncharacterized protein LOC123977590 isoform X5 [Micropterus dolomieu]|uniref:uncharacterized protein LOC123977590 isoform X5 n=1 Tax=Micropterus dolomieu TaxID=147949 RepID=UPI001E8EB185|nr:uncharacterized protein LOC123977590 isoform X5 [Micropterus dolomieu]
MIAVPTSSPLLAPFFREFFLVLNKAKTPAMAVSSFQQKSLTKVSYPEEVDVIVETLQGIFTRGSLQQHHELTLTTLRPGAPPVWLPQPKYGHTQMDPPPSFEPLQAQRIKKPAHCCVDVLRCVCGQGTTGQVDKASHEKWAQPGPNILTERGFSLISQETPLLRHILFTRSTTQPFPKIAGRPARLQDLSKAP